MCESHQSWRKGKARATVQCILTFNHPWRSHLHRSGLLAHSLIGTTEDHGKCQHSCIFRRFYVREVFEHYIRTPHYTHFVNAGLIVLRLVVVCRQWNVSKGV
jgi:hypothetical protein